MHIEVKEQRDRFLPRRSLFRKLHDFLVVPTLHFLEAVQARHRLALEAI